MAVPDQASVILDSFSLAFTLAAGFTVRDIVAGARGRQLHVGEIAIEAPFSLAIRGRQWPDLEFSILDMQVARPLPLVAEHITGKVVGLWATPRINGTFRLQNGKRMLAALGQPGEIARPYAVDGNFQGSLKTGSIAWTMQARGKRSLAVALGRDSLRGWLDLNASLSGDGQRLHASAAYRMPAADLQLAGYRARAGLFSGDAELDYIFGKIFRGRGRLKISGGQVAASAGNGLEASGIQLKFPWHWPGSGLGVKGGFSIARLQSNGTQWRDISGTLAQEDSTFRFSGSMHSVLAKIALTFQGLYKPSPAGGSLQADFLLPAVVLPAKTDAAAPASPAARDERRRPFPGGRQDMGGK